MHPISEHNFERIALNMNNHILKNIEINLAIFVAKINFPQKLTVPIQESKNRPKLNQTFPNHSMRQTPKDFLRL